MMRGERTWAVAVRTPEGDDRDRDPRGAHVGGALGEGPADARRHGARRVDGARVQGAHVVGRTARSPRRSRSRRKAMGMTIGVALALLHRDLHPDARRSCQRHRQHFGARRASGSTSSRARIRLGIFLGYLLLIGLLKDIKRVFQYHGAEHKAIAAYENDVEVTAESAQQFSTAARALRHQLPAHRDGRHHRRVLVRRAARRWPLLILSRIVLIPVIAGHRATRSSASRPGTCEWAVGARADEARPARSSGSPPASPTLDQVEVAVASLRAVLTAEQLAEVERPGRPRRPGSPARRGPPSAPPDPSGCRATSQRQRRLQSARRLGEFLGLATLTWQAILRSQCRECKPMTPGLKCGHQWAVGDASGADRSTRVAEEVC